MNQTRGYCLVVTMLLMTFSVSLGDEPKSCKCPVTGEKVDLSKVEASTEYRKATVYLCCNDCKKKFDAAPKKFSTKANVQLVSTGQAKQVKCPIAGRPLDVEQSIVVEKVKVSFCCGNCKSKAAAAEGDKQLAMCFGDKTFAKAFTVVTDKD